MNRAALVLFVTLICSAGGLGLVSAQTTATWIGPATGGLWSNPANWDIGVVPINNGANTYNVIVPAGRTINFDIAGANNIAGLNLQNTGQINFGIGQSLNVTGFTLIAGNISANGIGSSFNATSGLTALQPSPELHATNGAIVTIDAPAYTNNRLYYRSFMSAIGNGSRLNLQTIGSFNYNASDNGGYYNHTVEASQGGVIDLSGVQTINGAPGSTNALRFLVNSGGQINLQNLTTITQTNGGSIFFYPENYGRTMFDIQSGSYSLPSLVDADGVRLKVAGFAFFSAPNLVAFRNGHIDIVPTMTLNAPSLTDISGSYIRRSGASSMNTPQFSSINNAELHAVDGGIINVSAPTYSSNRLYYRSFMSAIGNGSRLNLQTIGSFNYNASDNGGYHNHTVEAAQGGLVDLAGLQSISGAPGINTLRFLVSSSSRINIGTAGQTTNLIGGNTRFEVTGTNSVIRFGSNMNMAANTEMKATLNGRFEAEGNLSIRTTNPANFDLKDGILRMVGNGSGGQLQSLEVISTNNGVPSGLLGNIGQIGQLQIGTSSITSRVILQDSFNNNGSPFDREALYLQGFPATNGLSILNGSSLILNGLDAYTSDGQGNFTSLRSLIPTGQRFVAYGSGFISLTGEVGEVLNRDFESGSDLGDSIGVQGFIIKAPSTGGGGRVVSGPTPGNPNNRVGEIYAGSEVDLIQQVSTHETAFSIEFDAWAKDSSGTLSVLLDNVLLGSWDYTELSGGDFSELSIMVNDPSLWGLIDKSLTFRWDANTGHRVWLDNIQMIAVPEPGTGLALLLLGLSWNLGRRRRAG